MSCYTKIILNCTTFDELIMYLHTLLPKLRDSEDIISVVRIIDILEKERDEDRDRYNEDIKRSLEIQKLFEESYQDGGVSMDNFMYNKIQKLFQDYGYCQNIESDFHIIMEIIDLFDRERNNE